jgi:hemerythrin
VRPCAGSRWLTDRAAFAAPARQGEKKPKLDLSKTSLLPVAPQWGRFPLARTLQGKTVGGHCQEATMPLLRWGPEHSVRVRPIDEQHKKLMSAVNNLCEVVIESKDGAAMDRALGELVANARLHFLEEQARHRAQQQRLVEAIQEYRQSSDAGSSVATTRFIHFLRDWLHTHIKISHAALELELRDAQNDRFSVTADAA